MTVIARRFASTPARTATETWSGIVELISKGGSQGRNDLIAVSGIAACVIAGEIPSDVPIVLTGSGPRLRIYCAYGGDAVLGEECDESSLTWNPTDGAWKMYLPCEKEDLDWIVRTLRSQSARVFAYDIKEGIADETGSSTLKALGTRFRVNIEGFLKK